MHKNAPAILARVEKLMIVTDEIKDNAMKEITEYFNRFPFHHIGKEFLVLKGVCGEDDVEHLIDVLEQEHLISYKSESFTDPKEIRLEPKGKIYFEQRDREKRLRKEQQRREKKETRRFWITLLKDIIIFIIGLIVESQTNVVQNVLITFFPKG